MSIQIELIRGERFTEQVVEKGDSDPYGHLKIRVNGSDLVGSEDTNVGVWITTDLIRLLAQTEAVFEDEKDVVAFDNGPSYLVTEPSGESEARMNVTHCLLYSGVDNPDKRLPIEETFKISKREWTEELVRVADTYLEELTELNPDLKDSEIVKELQEEIADAKERLKNQ